MRKILLLLALLTMAAQAVPLTVTPEAKARSFVIETGEGWVPSATPNTLQKREKDDPETSFPQTIAAFATYDRDAGTMVETMKRLFPGKLQPIKLGDLDALMERDTTGFQIHAGQGSTKITISYHDGRSSLNQASQDALLKLVTSSFRWAR